MNEFPLVSVITVNYNTSEEVCDLIRSIKEASYPNYEIIIVDNASPKDNPDIITEKYPEVKLIKTKENLGFAGANNIGVKEANGEYLYFLNGDVEVDPGCFEPLVETLENNPNIGMVSPKVLYYGTHRIQYIGTGPINKWTGRGFNYHYQKMDSPEYDVSYPTHFAFGAAMMIPTKLVYEVGLMPDVYFLYYEELDWCEMFRNAGYEIYYVGTSKIFHKDSVAIGKGSPIQVYYRIRNRILFQRRNVNAIQLMVSYFHILVIATPFQILKYLLEKQPQLLRCYLKGIVWHLSHSKVHKTPQLNLNTNGKKEIIDYSNERLVNLK